MNCTRCGAQLLESASFCTACGTPVPKEPPKPPASTANPYESLFDFAAKQCLIYGHKARVGPVNADEMGYGASLLDNLLHDFAVHDIAVEKAGFIKEVYVYSITRKLYIHLLNRWYDAHGEKKVDVMWSDLEKYCAGGLEGLFADVPKGSVAVNLLDHQSIPYIQKFPGITKYLQDTVVYYLVYYLVASDHDDYNADYERMSRLLGEQTVSSTIQALVEAGNLKFNSEN